MQEILINIEAGERRVALLRSKKLEWYFVERVNERPIVGNLYKARVNAVFNGMGAAFVDYGVKKNGFLYVSDITSTALEDEDSEFSPSPNGEHAREIDAKAVKIGDILKKGQEILVQVVKDELGTKGARLTTHMSLPGRYVVLMPYSTRVGVSRKIKDENERRRIKGILQEQRVPKDIGLVARTAAEGCSRHEMIRDVHYLLNTYHRIKKLAAQKKAPSLLFEELDLSLKVIRDFLNVQTDKIMVDDRAEYKKIKHFICNIAPHMLNRLHLYQEQVSLFEKYDIDKEIDSLFERKIGLRCGGYITIEQTEGMVAIDVNSGRFTGRKDLEDTIFKVNCEAAEEVARQVRLRDIGGIIIIDFIDMESQGHRRQVFSILEDALKKDKAKTQIISMSELDVVEMTRQRIKKSLESVSYQNCPYCEGRGRIKSAVTMSIIAQRKLKSFLRENRAKRIPLELIVHPEVAQRLVNEDARSLDTLRRDFRRFISVVADDTLRIDEVKIVPVHH